MKLALFKCLELYEENEPIAVGFLKKIKTF